MIKNLMKKIILSAFLIFSSLFFSCHGLFSPISDNSDEKMLVMMYLLSQKNQNGYNSQRFSSSLSGKIQAPFSNSVSRNIAPSFPTDNLSYNVYACVAGETAKAFDGDVSSDGSFSITILSDGNYIVYAEVLRSGQIIYKGESENLTIVGGKISKNGTLTTEIGEIAAKPVQSDSGEVAISIDTSSTKVGSIKAEWKKNESGASSLSYSTQSSSFTLYMTDSNNTEQKINSGNYSLTLYFYSDSSCANEIYRINEAVQVYDNLTASVCSGNSSYFSGGTIKITNQLIDGTAYAAGNNASSLVKNGNGENGTYYAPFSSISAALEKVKASGSSEMTIYIDGTFSGGISLSVDSGKTLNLCGLNGAANSVVSGGSGISVSGGTVNLKDISVKGVEGTSSTGVYVSGTSNLENVTVESCFSTGVYLSSGSVSLKNCEIKNNGGMGLSATSGSVSLTDCTITDNTTSGVNASSSSLSLGGKIVVKDNGGTTKKNITIAADKTMTISSALSPDSEIGVSLTTTLSAGGSKPITSGFTTNSHGSDAAIFSSDDDSCSVSLVSSEVAILKDSVIWISSGGKDENSGTYDYPFASFSKAFESFSDKTSAANVVKIKDNLSPSAGLDADVSVTAVIQGAAGTSKDGKATIDLTGISWNNNGTKDNASGFRTNAGQNLTFRNLTFTTNGTESYVYGAVSVAAGANVTIENCEFTNIYAKGACSAIALEDGNLTLSNVTITNNKATLASGGKRTYAVGFMGNAGTLTLSGKVTINGNTASDGTTAGNVYLASGKTFKLDSSFSSESRISFSAEAKPESSAVTFATGYSLSETPDTIFTNDDGYDVGKNSSNKLVIEGKTSGMHTSYTADGINIIELTSSVSTLESGKTYLIPSKDSLSTLATLVNGGQSGGGATFVMTGNIDLGSTSPNIGVTGTHFKGVFDGNNYCIYNYLGTDSSYSLFSYADNATVKKLRIKGNFQSGQYLGSVIAYAYGNVSIENCISDVNYSSNFYRDAGGFIGYINEAASVTIKNCVNNGNITTTREKEDNVAGFVGYVVGTASLTITNCVNNGSISSSKTSNYLAGFSNAGSGGTSNIQYCVNNGTISSSGSQIGAFTGDSYSKISSSRYYKPSGSNITAKHSESDSSASNLSEVSSFDSNSASSIAATMNSYISGNSDYIKWKTNSSGFPDLDLQIEDVSN